MRRLLQSSAGYSQHLLQVVPLLLSYKRGRSACLYIYKVLIGVSKAVVEQTLALLWLHCLTIEAVAPAERAIWPLA